MLQSPRIWGVAKLVRQRTLDPSFEGSSPSSPAKTAPPIEIRSAAFISIGQMLVVPKSIASLCPINSRSFYVTMNVTIIRHWKIMFKLAAEQALRLHNGLPDFASQFSKVFFL